MDEVLFSVIIPLYNKANSIDSTIHDVLLQTEERFEIIVVDDGSTDEGADIVKAFSDVRIKLIQQNNQGVSAARNAGIAAATGKYISFLDADDNWAPNYLSTTRKLFEKYTHAKIACPSFKVKYNDREVIPTWRGVSTTEDCLVPDFLETAKAGFWIVNSSCISIERNALLTMEPLFPVGESVYEDFDLWLRLGITFPMAHSNKICATYNRITDKNARISHTDKVVYSKTYMTTLRRLMNDCRLSEKQRVALKEISDRRMVPYIFSLLLTQDLNRARKELSIWKPVPTYKKYKYMLTVGSYAPDSIIALIQKIRYKLF